MINKILRFVSMLLPAGGSDEACHFDFVVIGRASILSSWVRYYACIWMFSSDSGFTVIPTRRHSGLSRYGKSQEMFK